MYVKSSTVTLNYVVESVLRKIVATFVLENLHFATETISCQKLY